MRVWMSSRGLEMNRTRHTCDSLRRLPAVQTREIAFYEAFLKIENRQMTERLLVSQTSTRGKSISHALHLVERTDLALVLNLTNLMIHKMWPTEEAVVAIHRRA